MYLLWRYFGEGLMNVKNIINQYGWISLPVFILTLLVWQVTTTSMRLGA